MKTSATRIFATLALAIASSVSGLQVAHADSISATINSVGENGYHVAGWIATDITFTGGAAAGGPHCLKFIQDNATHLSYRYTQGGKTTVIPFGQESINIVDVSILSNSIECRMNGRQSDFLVADKNTVTDVNLEVLWDNVSLSSKPFKTFDWSLAPSRVAILSPSNATSGAGIYELTLSQPDPLFELVETAVCIDKVGTVVCGSGGQVQNANGDSARCGDYASSQIPFGSQQSLGQYASGKASDATHVKLVIPSAGNYLINVIRHYRMPYWAYSDQQTCFSSQQEIVINNSALGAVSPANATWASLKGFVGIGSTEAICSAAFGTEPPYPGDQVDCTITLKSAPALTGTVPVKIFAYPPISGPSEASKLLADITVPLGIPTKVRFTLPASLDSSLVVATYMALGITLDGSSTIPTELTSLHINAISRSYIIGGNTVGSTLSAGWEYMGKYFFNSYKWFRDGLPIAGATKSTYVVSPADSGHRLSVEVGANPPLSISSSSRSAEIQIGQSSSGNIPTPKIAGAARVGQQLKANAGTLPSGSSVQYQWLRNGSPIAGATGPLYKVSSSDRGKAVSVKVLVTNPGFTAATKTSASVRIK